MMQTVSEMGFQAKAEKPGSALASHTQAVIANQTAGQSEVVNPLPKARRAGATEVEA